jgi:putative toxin-antitoxin system antitoxin component (TIGR02293 family)
MPKQRRTTQSQVGVRNDHRRLERDAGTGRFLPGKRSRTVDRALVIEEIMALATRVVGSREAAERWLGARVPALDGARPKELLGTPEGANRVREALHQIEHGIFA